MRADALPETPVPRTSTTATTILTTLAVLACTLLTACAPVQDAVDDARSSVEEGLQTLRWCSAAFRLGAAVATRDVEAASSAAEDLRDDAPEELTDELETILAAVAAAQDGDPQAVATDEVRAAGEAVLAEARARCDPSTDPTS